MNGGLSPLKSLQHLQEILADLPHLIITCLLLGRDPVVELQVVVV